MSDDTNNMCLFRAFNAGGKYEYDMYIHLKKT